MKMLRSSLLTSTLCYTYFILICVHSSSELVQNTNNYLPFNIDSNYYGRPIYKNVDKNQQSRVTEVPKLPLEDYEYDYHDSSQDPFLVINREFYEYPQPQNDAQKDPYESQEIKPLNSTSGTQKLLPTTFQRLTQEYVNEERKHVNYKLLNKEDINKFIITSTTCPHGYERDHNGGCRPIFAYLNNWTRVVKNVLGKLPETSTHENSEDLSTINTRNLEGVVTNALEDLPETTISEKSEDLLTSNTQINNEYFM